MRSSGRVRPLLSARELAAGYDGRAILPPVDLEVRRGEMWALVGRNGGGKTTLMRTLLGLLPPVAGEVAGGHRVSYVAQRGNYDRAMPARVVDFVQGGADHGWSFLRPLRRRRQDVERALEAAGANALVHRQYGELSEGQKQRVLIARALVCQPDLIVLDEPTSAMDPFGERAVFGLLDRLRRERGVSSLLASHHMHGVREHATHLVLVDRDEQVALAGEADAVRRAAPFRHLYGEVADG